MVQVGDDDCTAICCTPLPLREGECTYLQQGADSREKLVGYYAGSLRQLRWDYDLHPQFAAFCAGVLYIGPSPGARGRVSAPISSRARERSVLATRLGRLIG
jgi:hypothetical protein